MEGRKKMFSGDVILSENNILGDLNTTVPRIKKKTGGLGKWI